MLNRRKLLKNLPNVIGFASEQLKNKNSIPYDNDKIVMLYMVVADEEGIRFERFGRLKSGYGYVEKVEADLGAKPISYWVDYMNQVKEDEGYPLLTRHPLK